MRKVKYNFGVPDLPKSARPWQKIREKRRGLNANRSTANDCAIHDLLSG